MPPIALKIKLNAIEAERTAEAIRAAAEEIETELFSAWTDADINLMALGKMELAVNGETRRADRATREMNKILAVAVKLNNELAEMKLALDKLARS